MKIERLELFGYKRLMLGNIRHLTYTPTAPYQLILGTNGSGKSSVLMELSPLPAHSSNYTKEGYKDVTIRHKGSEYHLISMFKSGSKHNFIKDGVELNPGGTGAVQKELVKQEFGVTQELHAVLTGEVRFTDMPPELRRRWVTQLSSCDYSYALGVFNRMKTATRDHLGALKHLKQRLTQETNSLKALSGLEGLEQKAITLREELNALLSARTPGLPAYPQISQRVDVMLDRIDKLSRSAMELIQVQPAGANYDNVDSVNADVHRRESEIASTKTLLDRFTSEYSDLESIVTSVAGTGEITPESIETRILEIESEIDVLRPELKVFLKLEDAESLRRDTEKILPQVIELFGHIPDNEDRRFSRERVYDAEAMIAAANDVITKATAKVAQIEARIQMINSSKDTTRPECKYVWREGFSPKELKQLEDWSDDHNRVAERAREEVRRLELYMEEANHYSGLYNQFRGFVQGFPRMQPLWDYILENECLTNKPQSHVGMFFTWQREVELSQRIEELDRKHTHLVELAAKQRQLGGTHFTHRLEKLTEEIEATTGSLHRLRNEAKDVRQYRDRVLRVSDTVNTLDASVRELHQFYATAVASLRNQHIDAVAGTHQNELGLIQRQLTEKQALEGIVNDLTISHDDVELNHQAMYLLTQALSPTEGLIAEQLSGFIGCLTAQLNSILASVWTYDLEILPCGLDSGELDYKFPLQADGGDNEIPDISKGSTAQREIINFAFQLTVMLYLNLTENPLYLDELGSGFDEQHRVNVMNFVKQLMDVNQHSQVFMISHYASNHGALTNAEVLVLDSANIAVPGEYNKHVTMS